LDARLQVGDLFAQRREYLQCNFLNAIGADVIRSKAVRPACNALRGKGIFVGFGVSALCGNPNGIVARQIFPFKTGNSIEKNVIGR